MKSDSLFNYGMRPAVFSKTANETIQKGWCREGFNVSYKKNIYIREGSDKGAPYYTLTFTYTFEHANDTVFFAHCFPYTHTDLQAFLKTLASANPTQFSQNVSVKSICNSLGNISCEVLTVTSPPPPPSPEPPKSLAQPQPSTTDKPRKKKKEAVIIFARQHPGETPGSWMMEGVIDYLCDFKNEESTYLRNQCVFKIIPMVNADGVIHGNYRTDLSGVDLNRNWLRPSREQLPTVCAIKLLVAQLASEYNIRYIIDLHGHSKKMNVFFYGNSRADDSITPRIFPLACAEANPHIDFSSCSFRMQASKAATARIALFNYLPVGHRAEILTVEASFSGFSNKSSMGSFTPTDYKNVGASMCRTLALILRQEDEFLTQLESDKSKSGVSVDFDTYRKINVYERLFRNFKCDAQAAIKSSVQRDEIATKLEAEAAAAAATGKTNNDDDEAISSGGSDSDPEADELSVNEVKALSETFTTQSHLQQQQRRHTPNTLRPRIGTGPIYSRGSSNNSKAINRQHKSDKNEKSFRRVSSIMQTGTANAAVQAPDLELCAECIHLTTAASATLTECTGPAQSSEYTRSNSKKAKQQVPTPNNRKNNNGKAFYSKPQKFIMFPTGLPGSPPLEESKKPSTALLDFSVGSLLGQSQTPTTVTPNHLQSSQSNSNHANFLSAINYPIGFESNQRQQQQQPSCKPGTACTCECLDRQFQVMNKLDQRKSTTPTTSSSNAASRKKMPCSCCACLAAAADTTSSSGQSQYIPPPFKNASTQTREHALKNDIIDTTLLQPSGYCSNCKQKIGAKYTPNAMKNENNHHLFPFEFIHKNTSSELSSYARPQQQHERLHNDEHTNASSVIVVKPVTRQVLPAVRTTHHQIMTTHNKHNHLRQRSHLQSRPSKSVHSNSIVNSKKPSDANVIVLKPTYISLTKRLFVPGSDYQLLQKHTDDLLEQSHVASHQILEDNDEKCTHSQCLLINTMNLNGKQPSANRNRQSQASAAAINGSEQQPGYAHQALHTAGIQKRGYINNQYQHHHSQAHQLRDAFCVPRKSHSLHKREDTSSGDRDVQSSIPPPPPDHFTSPLFLQQQHKNRRAMQGNISNSSLSTDAVDQLVSSSRQLLDIKSHQSINHRQVNNSSSNNNNKSSFEGYSVKCQYKSQQQQHQQYEQQQQLQQQKQMMAGIDFCDSKISSNHHLEKDKKIYPGGKSFADEDIVISVRKRINAIGNTVDVNPFKQKARKTFSAPFNQRFLEQMLAGSFK